jgi:hypothetical protein
MSHFEHAAVFSLSVNLLTWTYGHASQESPFVGERDARVGLHYTIDPAWLWLRTVSDAASLGDVQLCDYRTEHAHT